MKVELKKVKINKAFSEETACFKAELHIDGKLAGFCKNDGRGGPTDIRYENQDIARRFREFCKSQPSMVFYGISIEITPDHFIDTLVDDFQENASLKRKCKKKTVFKTKDVAAGEWLVVNSPYTPKIKEELQRKYSIVEFANDRFT